MDGSLKKGLLSPVFPTLTEGMAQFPTFSLCISSLEVPGLRRRLCHNLGGLSLPDTTTIATCNEL